jgi:hypothetical protein
MTVKRDFAKDGGDLDASMDQLIEVLARLLGGPPPQRQTPISDLRFEDKRAIHVVEKELED